MSLLSLLLISNFFLSPVDSSLDNLDRLASTDAKETHIYIVRHGESAFNQPDSNGVTYTSGKSHSVPLTDKGKKQATDLGKKLKGKLDADAEFVVLSSTALRAKETADRIFDELREEYAATRGSSHEDLCELGQGVWEGKPKDAEYERAAKHWDTLSAKDKFYTPKLETGECHAEVAERMLNALQKILEENRGKTVFVVSHYAATNSLALEMSHAVADLSEEPGSELPRINLQNCDLVEISVPEGRSIKEATIIQHIKSDT